MTKDKLTELLSRATPGPWEARQAEEGKAYARVRGTRLGGKFKIANALGGATDFEAQEAEANAELIALAPTLASDNLRLQEEVDRLRGALIEGENALDAAARTINGDDDGAMDAIQIVRGKIAIRSALNGDRHG